MPLALVATTLTATTTRQGPVTYASDGEATASRAVQADDTRLAITATTGVASGDIVFGSGSDGDQDLNGGAVTGYSLVSTVYRATQNINASNLTIRAGYSIDPNGWPIRVRNLLTMETGTFISNDGGSTTTSAAGAGALPASAPSSTSAPFYGGSAGGAGRASVGVGAAPNTPTGVKLGGAGWAVQTAPSGGGCTLTVNVSSSDVATAYARYNGDPYQLLLNTMRLLNGTSLTYATGATGGSGGAWSHTSGGTGSSGGAGGGGGVLVLAARKITTSGTGHRFSANGGNGANANLTAGTNAAAGGGAGGNGGYVLVQIGQVVSGSPPPVQANGGNGGNGSEFGYVTAGANGGNGGNGGAGLYVIGTYSGAAPTNTATGGTPGTGSAHGVSGTVGTSGSVTYPGGYT